MHLLAATPGQISDGVEPVDPGQTPADVIFLSAADTELAALSQARRTMSAPPGLRLANLGWLAHPFTVDKYIDDTALGAKLVIVRALGGRPYWPYALEQLSARLGEAGVAFAALPGDDKPDEELFGLSSVSRHRWEMLWSYLVEGGPVNARHFLAFAGHMLGQGGVPPSAEPLLRAGFYWPDTGIATAETVRSNWIDGAPVVALTFYRALLQGAGLHPVDRMVGALRHRGLNPLPVFVASLKEPVSVATLEAILAETPPALVLNATGFAVSSLAGAAWQTDRTATVLDAPGVPVLQVILSSGDAQSWTETMRGLTAREIAMNVALPEVDGRLLTRAISFKTQAYFDEATECAVTAYRARDDRVRFVADLAANWVGLARSGAADRKVALLLANYPNKDGRLANGVGLDTPAATMHVLREMKNAGYAVENERGTPDDLMARIMAGPTNWLTDRAKRAGGETLSLAAYLEAYDSLPCDLRRKIERRWGRPQDDPFFLSEKTLPGTASSGASGRSQDGCFALSLHRFGNAVVGVQPARGYNIDPDDTYHSPDLPPPHNYFAFYFWLRVEFGAHAIVHMGKHGNLEWLPGKAVALSESCFPEAVLGPMPHIYPFIVNDPGEGTQAKRRAQAVIVDHLTPPMTRAETYGPLRDLETLVDEYHQAAGVDPRRIEHLRREILSLMKAAHLDADLGGPHDEDADSRLARLDAYLCELKESQIRDGLHVFGQAPQGGLADELIVALARVPRGAGQGGDMSLHRALAADLKLEFDPLDCDMAAVWDGPKPGLLERVGQTLWRSAGDTVERLEALALALVRGEEDVPGPLSAAVMEQIQIRMRPAVETAGRAEIEGVLTALDGRFVPPGPSGAPTRGRLDVLPTGRNFFSVDNRAVPTPAAWTLGWKSATLLIERHLQDCGEWPRAMALTAWGTANMRTGGDDIAQALALMGCKPRWERASGRVVGFEILPAGVLGRPRVDVTLRVSGFFRDAFPAQIDLIASAARAVMQLDESEDQNPAAARFRAEGGDIRAGFRVFGAKPGAYGAGLQAMIDERLWDRKADLAEAFLDWGGYAYGEGADGTPAREAFAHRLGRVEAVVQNQDNREHDLLDSDDYYQFEGGMAATVQTLRGAPPQIYHNDHSRPERPVIRTLDQEMARVVRARAANPKWIAGVMRHGYKGAFEMAATVDYLFAFAATTHAVRGHHFDMVYDAYLEDEVVRGFIEKHNAPALREMAQRFREAIDRGLWNPRSNSARARLSELAGEDALG
ncbi:MAG: cobaltochelatase subunit CobN [Pseudomonadota bacterium]